MIHEAGRCAAYQGNDGDGDQFQDGNLIDKPLPGAGEANSYCKARSTGPCGSDGELASLGIEINFGKLKLLDLGDLTWDKEMQLMCPVNKAGTYRYLYRFASWVGAEFQPGTGRCDSCAGGDHG
jgi:hypothetical protein